MVDEGEDTFAELVPGIWTKRYPLRLLGASFGRTVTVIQLGEGGHSLVHSTAPYSDRDLQTIESIGSPVAVCEGSALHDSFSSRGASAFGGASYCVPSPLAGRGGEDRKVISSDVISRLSDGDVSMIELEGAPRIGECVFCHHPSKTLIVSDLLFHFGEGASAWTRGVVKTLSGLGVEPGVSRLFRICIKDRKTFRRSVEEVLEWDFDRVVVGHGIPVIQDAKEVLRSSLSDAGIF